MSANPWLEPLAAVTSDGDLPAVAGQEFLLSLAEQDTATCKHCLHWSGSGGTYGVCISIRALAVLRHSDERCERFRVLGASR